MSFLKAEWRKLAMANFEINPEVLAPHVPFGTELDLWKGKCYVSLVGFMFKNTKVLGVKVPFHVDFEEVNLRFYVKRRVGDEWRRGVVFIKEIVPKRAITIIANTLYKEKYETLKMKHTWAEQNGARLVEYNFLSGSKWQFFKVYAESSTSKIEEGSEAEFITEHYWGYARVSDKKSNEYEVTHPKWEQYKVKSFDMDIDFGLVYGPDFSFINKLNPSSVFLAEGSHIAVESKKTISIKNP